MPVRAFPANFGFHFRRTGTMQSGDIGFLFGFGLDLVVFFRLVFLAFENNTAHHCFFYTHVVDVLSINVKSGYIAYLPGR